MTDDVIARRVFKIDGQQAECRFYKPQEDAGSFSARFKSTGQRGRGTKGLVAWMKSKHYCSE